MAPTSTRYTGHRLAGTLQVLRDLGDAFRPHYIVYGGDWNFIESEEGLLHTTAGARYTPSTSSPLFHRLFPDLFENRQPLYTFKRTTSTATDATLSTIGTAISTRSPCLASTRWLEQLADFTSAVNRATTSH